MLEVGVFRRVRPGFAVFLRQRRLPGRDADQQQEVPAFIPGDDAHRGVEAALALDVDVVVGHPLGRGILVRLDELLADGRELQLGCRGPVNSRTAMRLSVRETKNRRWNWPRWSSPADK